MIRVFATLKLRLLRNLLRTESGIPFVLFSIISLGFGGLLAYILLLREPADGVLPLGTAALVIAWTFGPLLFGAADETIDSTRLALFPVPARQLAPGMVVANLIGPGPVAIALPLAAAALRAESLLAKVVALLAAATTVVLASVLSRWVQTLLGSALRKRSRRDFVIVIAGLFAGILGIGSQVLVVIGFSSDRLAQFGRVARWFPGGWTGWAIQSVQTASVATDYLVPLGAISATILLAIVAAWRWIIALEEALAEVADGGVDEVATGHFMDSVGFRGWIFAKLGVYGPVLAKELRYLRRHPRYRVQVVTQFIVLILGGAPFLAAILEKDPTSVLVACVPALTAGITASNLLGADGRALWGEVLAVDSMVVILRGRSLAFFGLGVGSSVLVILLTATYTGGWNFALIAFAASIGMGFAGAGTGAYTSTLAPVLLPDESNPNPFASGDMGQGCVSGIFTLGGAAVGLTTSAPILAGLGFARTEFWAQLAVIFLAPIYGFGVYVVATRLAARRADLRIPDLIATLT